MIGGGWAGQGGESCFVQFAAAVCMGTASHGRGGNFRGMLLWFVLGKLVGGGGGHLAYAVHGCRQDTTDHASHFRVGV